MSLSRRALFLGASSPLAGEARPISPATTQDMSGTMCSDFIPDPFFLLDAPCGVAFLATQPRARRLRRSHAEIALADCTSLRSRNFWILPVEVFRMGPNTTA